MLVQVQELRSKLVRAESAAASARSAADTAEVERLRRQLEESLRNEERLRRQLLEVCDLQADWKLTYTASSPVPHVVMKLMPADECCDIDVERFYPDSPAQFPGKQAAGA